MTVREKAIQMMEERGMFRDKAEEVMKLVEADPANEVMQGRWGDDLSGYPAALMSVMWLAVKRVAAEYIAEHQPLAWYRPLFDDATEARRG